MAEEVATEPAGALAAATEKATALTAKAAVWMAVVASATDREDWARYAGRLACVEVAAEAAEEAAARRMAAWAGPSRCQS